jgi:hypothetical protein
MAFLQKYNKLFAIKELGLAKQQGQMDMLLGQTQSIENK